jgi:hypothetical protein
VAPKSAAGASRRGAPKPGGATARLSRRAQPSDEEEDADAEARASARESLELLRKRKNRTIYFSLLLLTVLSAVAAFVIWNVLGIKRSEAAAQEAFIAKRNEVYERIMGANPEDEAQARELVEYAALPDVQAIWSGDERAPDIQSRVSRAKASIERFEQSRELLERHQQLEARLADPDSLTSEDLVQIARDLEAIAPRASIVSEEFAQKIAEQQKAISDSRSAKLIAEAQEAAQDVSTPAAARAALAKYALAEEEIQKLLDAAYKAWQAKKDDPELLAERKRVEELYQLAIRESDELGSRVYTEEFVAQVPWVDLLSEERASQWIMASVKGFSRSIENGVLHVVGPDPDATAIGVLSIGDAENWRDFNLEMEITLLSGTTDLFLRLGPTVSNVESTVLSTEGDAPLPANEPITIEISFIGSTWTYYAHSDSFDPGSPSEYSVNWVSQRHGAIGFRVPSGTEFKVTKMRIQVLR